jgi:hypothetical protein
MYHYFSERHRLAEEAVQAEPVRSDIGLALILDSEKSDALGKVLRYENTLTNGLARTLSILISLQTSRKAHEEVSKEIAVAPT